MKYIKLIFIGMIFGIYLQASGVIKGEIVVSTNVGVSLYTFKQNLKKADTNNDIKIIDSYETIAPKRLRGNNKNAKTLKVLLKTKTLSNKELMRKAMSMGVVEYATFNSKLKDLSIPNDKDFSKSWALQERDSDTDIDIQSAWDITKGSSNIVIGLIDTGMTINHPDLKNNLYVNEAELNGAKGVDDDNNGYIDDINGWSSIHNNGDITDTLGHGTAVSGVMIAQMNNKIGTSGVAPNAKLLTCQSAAYSDYLTSRCISYMNTLKHYYNQGDSRGVNIIATNNSYGGLGYNHVMYEAIEIAKEENILFVTSSGNDDLDGDKIIFYPSSYELDNILSVGGIDKNSKLIFNYGMKNVDIAAPADEIYTTSMDGKYRFAGGTSFASPFVTAAAYLLASKLESVDGNMSVLNIKRIILNSAKSKISLQSKNRTGGMLSVYNALTYTDDDLMHGFGATSTNNNIELFWDYDNSDVEFEIYQNGVLFKKLSGNKRKLLIESLVKNSEYSFYINIKRNSKIIEKSRTIKIKTTNYGKSFLNQKSKQFLVDLYNSTGGDTWTIQTRWLDIGYECSWHGVICNDAKTEIVTLRLVENQLKGKIPENIGDLSELTILILDDNSLYGEIPKSIGKLKKLFFMSFANNHLSGELPEIIGDMIALKEFNFFNNNLSGSLPQSLKNLPNLTKGNSVFAYNNLTADSSFDKWLNDYHNKGKKYFNDSQKYFKATDVKYTSATLKWHNMGLGMSGYEIFQDGKLIATLPNDAHEYSIDNLRDNRKYNFKLNSIYKYTNQYDSLFIDIKTDKKLITNITSKATIITNVRSWWDGNRRLNLQRMVDLDTSSSQSYAVHPLDADGKNITFRFDKKFNDGSFVFYNRGSFNSRIDGSTVIFKNNNKVVRVFKILNGHNVITFELPKEIVFDEVVLKFSGYSQNFREIKILGSEITGGKKFATNIAPKANISTNITTWWNRNKQLNLQRMVDLDTSVSQAYAVHPTNANNKNITFKFDKKFNDGSFVFYNRGSFNSRINGSMVIFKNDDNVVKVFRFSNGHTVMRFKLSKNIVFDEVILRFSGNYQNFREIKILGKELIK